MMFHVEQGGRLRNAEFGVRSRQIEKQHFDTEGPDEKPDNSGYVQGRKVIFLIRVLRD